MTFHVGQKVVCIDDRLEDGEPPSPNAVKGGVYTITEVLDFPGHGCALNFSELYYPGDRCWFPGFKAECFRPVKTTSIETFRQMLRPVPVKERA